MLTREERIMGLSKIWSDAKYNFARFSELKNLDWDGKYKECLSEIIDEEDMLIYYSKLMKFINLLKDGHSYVTAPSNILPAYDVPFGTSYLEGKHILTTVPEPYKHLLCSEIISINGVPIKDYLDNKVLPYVWHENMKARFYWGLLGYIISSCESDIIEVETTDGILKVQKGDKTDEVYVKLAYVEEVQNLTPVYEKDDLLTIYITNDNLCILHIPTFSDSTLVEELYSNIPKYKDCKGFLIDVRRNRGGSSWNSDAVTQMFFEGKFSNGNDLTREHIAAYYAYSKNRDISKLNQEDNDENEIYLAATATKFYDMSELTSCAKCPIFIDAPVVVLSSSCSASATESFLVSMKFQNRATIVGERSYGSNGQPLIGDLPGGGIYAICTMICRTEDGTDYNNIGITPDILIEPTIEYLKNRYDRILDNGLITLRKLVN